MPSDTSSENAVILPPPAPRRIDQQTTNNQTQDPYHWLQDKTDPEVIRYLNDENHYCQQMMQSSNGLQEQLYQELLGRINESDLSVAYRWQDYEYYSRSIQGKGYEQHWRRNISTGEEQLLLDENLLASEQPFFELGCLEVSPNQNLLAYCFDIQGDENYQLRVLDLTTGQLLTDSLYNCSGNIVWSMDSLGFHYGVLNDQHRPYQIQTHRLGTDQNTDTLVYEDSDERFFVQAYRSKSDAHLLIESTSKTTSEVWLGDIATLDQGKLRCFSARRNDHEYSVDHNAHCFIIRSNASGPNFALLMTATHTIGERHWKTLLPHTEQSTIEDFEMLADFLVVAERINGQARLRVIPNHIIENPPKRFELLPKGSSEQSTEESTEENPTGYFLSFPETNCSLGCVDNVELRSNVLRVRYESLISPASIWDIDLTTQSRQKLKEIEVVGGYDPKRFCSVRVTCLGHDGMPVPISMVGLKESFSQPAPLLLYAYGAYGESLDPWFSHARLNLLERGFIFAIAHVRGGGCLGESWYHQGRKLHKKNSFKDFIACSRHLIEQGYTSNQQLVISGGSAGGLLIGAVLNEAPELYQAAIADVPFVDVLNSMLDPGLPLTQTEYDEWGDPSREDVYRYIASYSPIDNVTEQHYPHMLVTAGLEDSRVPFWEPAKWVAQLRHKKTDSNLLLLKTLMDAGHGGVSGRYESMREIVFEQAFILQNVTTKDATAAFDQ